MAKLFGSFRHILILFPVFISISVKSADRYVTNTANAGPGSLRDQIGISAAGDRVIMGISGTVALTSPITVTTSVEVIGAFPVHNTINFSGVGINNYAFNVTGGQLSIRGFLFHNPSLNLNVGAIQVANTASLLVNDCVFEQGRANTGGAILTNGPTIINSSCFTQNSSVSDGGAIYVNGAAATCTLTNCTFSANNSNANGGAIRAINGPALVIRHCTFKGNTATNLGKDLSVAIAGTTVTLHNNIFDQGILGSLSNSGAANFVSQGGNIFTFVNPGFVTTSINDAFGVLPALLNLGLLVTDGYGMRFHRINSNASPATDNGTAGPLPLTDCRRAPRIMQGNTAMNPDAGAVEFSQYTVVNSNATGAGSLANAVSQVNANATPAPYYIDFIIPAPTPIVLGATLNITNPVIIDGYIQSGSQIGGPGNVPNSLTSLTPIIILDGAGATTNGIILGNTATNSFISGLNINGFVSNGIVIGGASGCKIQGNMVHSNGTHGIEIQGAAGANTIGDTSLHSINMISNNIFRGILINNSPGNTIKNNLIGTDQIGTAIFGNQAVGVEVSGAAATGNLIGGESHFFQGNILSGNTAHQVFINSSANANTVSGNKFGVTFNGQNPLSSAAANGVTISASNNTIGGTTLGRNNIICGQGGAGIFINGGTSNSVFKNNIGYSPIAAVSIANTTGIQISGTSTGNTIGASNGRNYISGNSGNGVRISSGAGGNALTNNFIGISELNNAIGNGGYGVFIETGSNGNSIGTALGGNYISSNGNSGIGISSSRNNTILNNTVGLDSSRTLMRSNTIHGIEINNGANTQVGGNIVCFNLGKGMDIISDSVNLYNNLIGTDITNSINQGNGGHGVSIAGNRNRVGNGSTADNTIAFNNGAGVAVISGTENGIIKNIILNNSGLGIDLGAVGVTPNDLNDADAGANTLINFADNFLSTQCGTGTAIAGEFYGIAGNTYRIDFYQVPGAGQDPSGHGEGNLWLGSSNITVTTTGYTFFSYFHATLLTTGTIVTATVSKFVAAGGYFETSEFSQNTTVVTGITTVNHTTNNVTCAGSANGSATATPVGGIAPFTYSWYTSTNTQITGQFLNTVGSLAPGSYYGIAMDASGCPDTTAVFTITEPLPITATATGSDPLCNGSCDGTITVTATGGTGIIQYSNDGGALFQASSVFSALCSGSYTNLVVSDQNNCTAPVTSVTLVDPPIIIVTSVTTVDVSCPSFCDGSISFSATGGTGVLNYSIDNGTLFNPSATFSGLCTGIYNTQIQDSNGCLTPITSVTIGTQTVLQANAGPDLSVCLGAPAVLDGSGSTNAISYSWYESGNATLLGSTAIFTSSPPTGTTYVLTITNGSCTSNDTVVVNILPIPDPNIVYPLAPSDTLYICIGGSTLTPTITSPGGIFTATGGITINATTGAADFSATSFGIFNIFYTTATCNQRDTIVALILPDPVAPVSLQYDYTICSGDPIPTFNTDQTGVFGLMTWYNTSALTIPVSAGFAFTPPNLPATYNDYFAAVNYTNCVGPSSMFTVSVIDNTAITATSPVSICTGETTILDLVVNTGTLTSIVWSPGGTLDDSTILQPTASPFQNTIYSYQALIGSCTLNGTIDVQISTDPNCIFEEVYNAFSPDGDGVNELWILPAAGFFPNNTVTIFNRWGDAIREFTNYDNVSVVWDGTNRGGQQLPSGTYFYVVRYHDADRQYSGWIQLTR
ncbi:MAG: gliding motility-associated C-terminal domain-containing protein [Flavobacteriales bacterium]